MTMPGRLSLWGSFIFRSKRANPFSSTQARRTSRLAAPRLRMRKRSFHLVSRWTQQLPRLSSLWLWGALLLFSVTGFACVHKILTIRHEQELRVSGRRIRRTESRLMQSDIQLRLARQENQKLRAVLSSNLTLLARINRPWDNLQPVRYRRVPLR